MGVAAQPASATPRAAMIALRRTRLRTIAVSPFLFVPRGGTPVVRGAAPTADAARPAKRAATSNRRPKRDDGRPALSNTRSDRTMNDDTMTHLARLQNGV